MKRILCPTDFSPTANNAIVFAAKFAQVTNSEIILLNVQSFFDLPPDELLKGKSRHVEAARSALETQAFEVAREFDISCYAEVQVSGVALSALISNVGAEFDLIVMGTNGPDDLYQFFTGSNTYNVIRKTTVPVLLIPATAEYQGIEKALFAYDYLREGMPPIEHVQDILHPFTFELRMLQLLEVSISPVQDEELKEREEQIVGKLPKGMQISFDAVHTDNLPHSLETYIKKHEDDLLIVNSKQYSVIRKIFHRSIIKALSVIADFPVLVIHE